MLPYFAHLSHHTVIADRGAALFDDDAGVARVVLQNAAPRGVFEGETVRAPTEAAGSELHSVETEGGMDELRRTKPRTCWLREERDPSFAPGFATECMHRKGRWKKRFRMENISGKIITRPS